MSSSPDLLYGLFRPECYDAFFVNGDFFHIVCLKFLISKILSYGIIVGAVGVKIPQIIKIVRSKSTSGLSLPMYVLENIGYLITVLANLRNGWPFSAYGENVFLLVQGFILVLLFVLFGIEDTTSSKESKKKYIYQPKSLLLTLFFLVFAGAMGGLGYYLYFLAPLPQLLLIQSSTIVIFASSRVPQIWNNFRSGSTGVLSFITVFLNFAGTSARIFTTLQEVNNLSTVALAGILSSWALNTIIFLQVLWYWNSDKALKKEMKQKSAKAQ